MRKNQELYEQAVKMTKAQIEAKERYRQKTRHISVEFNMETEQELYEFVQRQTSKQAYIKSLIRKNMEEINMYNTIILWHGQETLTAREFKKFSHGDSIMECDCNPVELKRWSADELEQAKEELSKYECTYEDAGELFFVNEYAIEFCDCDEDGDFIKGSDYSFAKGC